MDSRTEYSLKADLVRLFYSFSWRWLHEKLNRLEFTVFFVSASIRTVQIKCQYPIKQ